MAQSNSPSTPQDIELRPNADARTDYEQAQGLLNNNAKPTESAKSPTNQRTHAEEEMGSGIMDKLRRCLVEMTGDMIFVFIGILQATSNEGVMGAAAAHGITIGLLICGMGHISGGHFNPAVTTSVFVAGGIHIVDAILYILSQLLGGFLGSLIARACLDTGTYDLILGGATLPNATITPISAIVVEFMMAFFLAHTVLVTAVDTDNNLLAPFAIGLSIFVDILAGGNLSGASINPARSLGPAVTASIFGLGHKVWTMHYIYYVGPLLGGAAAGLLYKSFWARDDNRWLLKSAE